MSGFPGAGRRPVPEVPGETRRDQQGRVGWRLLEDRHRQGEARFELDVVDAQLTGTGAAVVPGKPVIVHRHVAKEAVGRGQHRRQSERPRLRRAWLRDAVIRVRGQRDRRSGAGRGVGVPVRRRLDTPIERGHGIGRSGVSAGRQRGAAPAAGGPNGVIVSGGRRGRVGRRRGDHGLRRPKDRARQSGSAGPGRFPIRRPMRLLAVPAGRRIAIRRRTRFRWLLLHYGTTL